MYCSTQVQVVRVEGASACRMSCTRARGGADTSARSWTGAGRASSMPRDLENELNALRKQRENKQCPNCAAEDRYGFKSACVKFE